MRNVIDLAARVLMALLFLPAGIGKLTHYAATAGYFTHVHIPTALLPLVILLEIGGGLAILLGFHTRIAAFALAVFCIAAAFLVHLHPGEPMQMINFWKNIALTGGFLAVYLHGAGSLSLDGRMRGRLTAAQATH